MSETTAQKTTPKQVVGTPRRRWVAPVVLGAVVVGAAVLLVGTDASSAFVYQKTVDEVAPRVAEFTGRELRVGGELREGSIRFREEPCEWRFVIEKNGHTMPVSYPRCDVPDTFRDGMGLTVTVQGRLRQDGSFLAGEIVPQCPSKYEMRERQRQGESMPHATPRAPGTPAVMGAASPGS